MCYLLLKSPYLYVGVAVTPPDVAILIVTMQIIQTQLECLQWKKAWPNVPGVWCASERAPMADSVHLC